MGDSSKGQIIGILLLIVNQEVAAEKMPALVCSDSAMPTACPFPSLRIRIG
jgi:hypothetical protein